MLSDRYYFNNRCRSQILKSKSRELDVRGFSNVIVLLFILTNSYELIHGILYSGFSLPFVLNKIVSAILSIDIGIFIYLLAELITTCLIHKFARKHCLRFYAKNHQSIAVVQQYYLELESNNQFIYTPQSIKTHGPRRKPRNGDGANKTLIGRTKPDPEKSFCKLTNEVTHFIGQIFLILLPFAIAIRICYLGPVQPIRNLAVTMIGIVCVLKKLSFIFYLYEIRKVYCEEVNQNYEGILNAKKNAGSLHQLNIVSTIAGISDEREKHQILAFPNCLSPGHFAKFFCYPTLCFQLSYPMDQYIDRTTLVKDIFGLLLCLSTMNIVYSKYVFPILNKNVYGEEISRHRIIMVLLRKLLQLGIPSFFGWLLMFLSMFNYFMPIVANLTRFGDKRFYDDWWNATSIAEYWRKWNLPVHHFCVRHIYAPFVRAGLSKLVATQIVFLLSALLHELVFITSLQFGFTGIVFAAFLAQAPLSSVTSLRLFRQHPVLGNYVVWLVMCLSGQPILMLMFTYLSQRQMLPRIG